MVDSSKESEVAVYIDDEEIKRGPPPPRRSMLQRVPAPLLRGNGKQKHIYEPVAVPLGPYHHGRLPEYELAEQVKEELLVMVCGDRDRGVPLGLVSERVAEIRQFYGGAEGYGDEELAAMMLLDTFLVLCCIKIDDSKYDDVIWERLGFSGVEFVYRDLFKLENQIPLWLITLLIPFAYEDDDVDGEVQVCEFLRFIYYDKGDMEPLTLPWRNGEDDCKPLHLLEVSHRLVLQPAEAETNPHQDNGDHTNRQPPKNNLKFFESPHRSATDLKAKGVRFRPSTHSLKDIDFFSFFTHGRLHLPLIPVNHKTRVFLSNLVAYEMSADRSIDMGITGYVNFMKTLLQRAEDVKLLRDKGVLYSMLANHDEVVSLFQDIDTYGLSNQVDLYDVRKRMEEHCNDWRKTWPAEFINTYFHSPFTAVALFAAAFILALAFLQTFYAINPRYANSTD